MKIILSKKGLFFGAEWHVNLWFKNIHVGIGLLGGESEYYSELKRVLDQRIFHSYLKLIYTNVEYTCFEYICGQIHTYCVKNQQYWYANFSFNSVLKCLNLN